MNQRLVGAALSTALLFSMSAAEAPQPPAPPAITSADVDPVSPSENQTMAQDFLSLRDYWAARKTGMSAVKLTVVVEQATATCSDGVKKHVIRSTNFSALEYCVSSNTVILSQAGLSLMHEMGRRKDLPEKSIERLIMAHELGHAVQKINHVSEAGKTEWQMGTIERQADCYGGEAISQVFPEDVSTAKAFYEGISPPFLDPTHGSAAQRTASFDQGALTGIC